MRARDIRTSAKKNHGAVRTSRIAFNQKGDVPLGANVRIGERRLCYTKIFDDNYTGPSKIRPVLIYGIFWNAEKTKIRAVAVIESTTQKMDKIYRSDFPVYQSDVMRKTSSMLPGKFRFSSLQVLPNNDSYFIQTAKPLSNMPIGDKLIWRQFIECRLYALFHHNNREYVGLSPHKIKDDWIYEGPVFTISDELLPKNVFTPDIAGAVKNQIPYYPAGLNQQDFARISESMYNLGPVAPTSAPVPDTGKNSNGASRSNGFPENGTNGAAAHPAGPDF